ncbi:MAG: D-glycero-beta-D-manno-heptose 1-phosphate adenylyltransferase [Bacteroidota bacterium]|nr:D-glycero-beta-D-manno-heptose 1-phosphate adenylyltransferase [Bacteroidota bacterium]
MLNYIRSKIQSEIADIDRQIAVWKFLNQKIVFTNGCFDILHRGHIDYLAKAADEGDLLLVGLNSDRSVKSIKGDNRPINNEDTRAMVLGSLAFVDAVFLFDEDTPYELIKRVQPDVLIKGADYNKEDIVGYDIVRNNGGEIKTIELLDGYSTTNLIDQIKSL